MIILFFIFSFILGTIIGSFLNVVILRHNTGVALDGRSGCMSCGKGLKWYELIPILSYLILGGKCSSCKSRISIQYPLVEFVTGILFLLIFMKFQDLLLLDLDPWAFAINTALYAIQISILVVIFVYDIYHKIIPDKFSYSFAIVSLVIFFLNGNPGFSTILDLLNLFSGILLFFPFYLLWFFSKGEWIGLGDGKLALGIGWLLGFVYGVSAIVIAFWIGAVVSILIMLIVNLKHGSKDITMKTEIPFAPFLIVGTLIELFVQVDVIGILNLIQI